MIVVFFTSILVGVVAILLLPFAWGVPFRFFAVAIPLRHFFLSSVASLFSGGLALLFGAPTHIGGAIALGAGSIIAFSLAFSRAEKKGLVLTLLGIRDPDLSEDARTLVFKKIDRAIASSARKGTIIALSAAQVLSEMDLRDEITNRLLAIKEVPNDLKGVHAQVSATLLMHDGRLEEAGHLINKKELGVENEEQEFWLQATRALWFALQAGVDKAEAMSKELWKKIPAVSSDDQKMKEATLLIIDAHCAACRGTEQNATALLHQSFERMGLVALAQAVSPIGPATELARALIEEKNGAVGA